MAHFYIKDNLKVNYDCYFCSIVFKSNFIYKYPPALLAMYTGISTPLILQGTSILRKCNSHTLTVTGKTMLLRNTTLFQNISKSDPQLQQFQRQKWHFISYGTNSQNTANRLQIIARFMHEAPLQQKEVFCTYKCAHAGI